MSDEISSGKKNILYTILITLAIGGSSPWWWDKIFAKKPQDQTESSTITNQPSPSTHNKSPVANAGSDVTITLPRNTVELNGSASHDPDGKVVSYLWEKQSGPSAGRILDADETIAQALDLTAGEYEFRLTINDDKGDRDVKVKKVIVVPASTPPVVPPIVITPVRTSVLHSFVLNEFGTWGTSKIGDNEMDTDEGDIVPVTCTTELIRSESRIILKVTLNMREDGGDHTTFNNTIERQVYAAPPGKRIVDLRIRGDQNLVRFDQESRNENHREVRFNNIGNTYWNSLRFRVDGPGSDDNTRIGVGGSMTCTIVLEDRN